MKTREQLYGKEAASLLRDISNYHCIRHEQIYRLYPDKDKAVMDNLLFYLTKQGRIFYDQPAVIFFADGETYEIICVPPDKEALIEHALSQSGEEDGRRIFIVEDAEQIARLRVSGSAAFCMVTDTGEIQYFKQKQEEPY